MLVLGIDPGLSGAAALVHAPQCNPLAARILALHDMPLGAAKQGKTIKNHLDLAALAKLMALPVFDMPDAAAIEEVHAMPGQGVTSMFRFGYAAGAVAGIAAAHGLPVHFIRPQEWQTLAGVRQGKGASRLRASQLFPAHAAAFGRVKDHGRADAALIAFSVILKNTR